MFHSNDYMFFYRLERFFIGLGKAVLGAVASAAFVAMLILFS